MLPISGIVFFGWHKKGLAMPEQPYMMDHQHWQVFQSFLPLLVLHNRSIYASMTMRSFLSNDHFSYLRMHNNTLN